MNQRPALRFQKKPRARHGFLVFCFVSLLAAFTVTVWRLVLLLPFGPGSRATTPIPPRDRLLAGLAADDSRPDWPPYESLFLGRDLLHDPPDIFHALLNHNQDIGMFANDRMVVLGLQKAAEFYAGNPHAVNLELTPQPTRKIWNWRKTPRPFFGWPMNST
jgi:hypothetical protein